MTNIPQVTICCITYNQEKFIAKALDSFLMQKTNFSFEILVHDDASTDSTADIIKEYQRKNPEKINTVLQKENQFIKKNGSVYLNFLFPLVKSKYIALCEGDDYWTDPYKLQKQVDALNENPKCDMCIHPAKVTYGNRVDSEKIMWKYSNEEKIFSIKDVLSTPGQFSPTASYVFKRSILAKLYESFKRAPVIDFYLEVFGSLSGGIVYLPEPMSVYRKNIQGSWTDVTLKAVNNPSVLELYQRMNKYLLILKDELPEYLGEYIDRKIAASLYGKALYFLANSDYKKFREYMLKSFDLYRDFSSFAKMIYFIRNFGWLAKIIYKMKLKYYNV